MNNSLVSIIVPCYNQANYLAACLRSVLEQTYTNWECIIINDGSTDKTELIAKTWIDRDHRFKYVCQDNRGLSAARNAGLSLVTGDYIQFLDADDILDSNKLILSLEECRKYSGSERWHIVICNFMMFKGDLTKVFKPYCVLEQSCFSFDSLLYGWEYEFTIPIHCGFFSSGLFKDFRFPEMLKAKEDWVMWLMLYKSDVQTHFIDKTLVFYRLHNNSMTQQVEFMEENYINALGYLRNIVNHDDYVDYLIFVLKQKQNRLNHLKTRIDNYRKSRGYKILRSIREQRLTRYIIKLLK
ncbi:glycosyltransferase family 2 protein [Gaetbulibacter saemankumensis]|uniref:glycosyltransferase family 2 protein n=1 Tax=Gaetbulibacter saemankumensis TaxID=311208 RepID=UPI00041450B7|nr:glycosyltransferase family 2 protein [Gaetbulibacter saemankumensis]